ncbi:MAG: regulatory protein GemA [Pseudodesulfovibrio sp.]|uniref:Mu GP16 GemA n=1 Tax=Pseudodesulfovibrio aespoeensis (strain ATCC 700646 / DSM 10631 / Aspo-2) TaxID=643562 RepID=E6VUD3_PSEA9|nr:MULTISPECIES: regulatory protein GemA [Pseudodesulfovibrio]MBU4192241.1 regulatory protein GemA [Pseudomonadota bacterium]ADU63440.1 Mu GP16 GemA [Pseudodesulfovibrio aespoeensis Aspo-2]MBU4243487.1 regulatory protein GemA [Pseudomonadota bacterium]MBU4473821.1 regulatory protein GemA [Pseudomonadota bacterium]MBU4517297.1 regulatory protein GemA [Pseudomonadota bacterium]
MKKPGMSPQARRGMISKIKIGQKQLGMTDDAYRDMLMDRYQKNSAATLSFRELVDLVAHMEALGAQFISKQAPKSQQIRDPQSRLIRSLWLQLHDAGLVRDSSEAAIAAYVKRQTGVESLAWLSSPQASSVIESLKQWLARADQPVV